MICGLSEQPVRPGFGAAEVAGRMPAYKETVQTFSPKP